jgi:putative phage-type endonuclease
MQRQQFKTEEEWLGAREGKIGASDVPAILGISPWCSPLTLYHEKVGLREDRSTTHTRWGKRLECVIGEAYAEETERPVLPTPLTLVQHPDLPILVASPDFLVAPSLGRKPTPWGCETVPLEVKSAHWIKAQEWQEEPPLDYQIQVQTQMAVFGTAWASIAALIGGYDFRWQDLPRDEVIIDAILRAVDEFARRILDHDPPPADGSESTKQLLKRLYPEPTSAELVALPGESLEWDAQRAEGKVLAKRGAAICDEAEAKLKAAIGAAEGGVLPNGAIYNWKLVNRVGYVVKATSYRDFRRKEPKGARA